MLSAAPDRGGRRKGGGGEARIRAGTMIRYGAVLMVASLVLFELLSYFGWTQRFLRQELNTSTSDGPDETIEDDRGCVLLDRASNYASLPDFTTAHLPSWTNCQVIKTSDEWLVEHCISPLAKHRADETGVSGAAESPSCLPGGYFRLQRLHNTPTTAATVGSSAGATADRCTPAPGHTLLENSLEGSGKILETSAQRFLGPDTFRITLVGPERLVLMQQQRLQNCTYGIPYQISEPGRFSVRRIEHLYEDFDAIDEDVGTLLANDDDHSAVAGSRPKMVAKDILDGGASGYEFDVCSHCRAHRTRHGIARCAMDPKEGSKQYGTYQHVAESTYRWVVARPPCEFYPTLEMFRPVDTAQQTPGATTSIAAGSDSNTTDEGGSNEMMQAKNKVQTCLQQTRRRILFAGDSHMQKLMEAVVQRMQGIQGDLKDGQENEETKEEAVPGQVARKLGRWSFTYDDDPLLDKTIQRLGYSLGYDIEEDEGEEEDQVIVDDLDTLERVDIVVVGLSSEAFAKQLTVTDYMRRAEKVLNGLVELQNMRYNVDSKINLRVIWMEMPAWTEVEGALSPPPTLSNKSRRDIANRLVARQDNDDHVHEDDDDEEEEEEANEEDVNEEESVNEEEDVNKEEGVNEEEDVNKEDDNQDGDQKAAKQRKNRGDLRTNPKIQFCNKQVDKLLDRVNGLVRGGETTTSPGGGVDRIPAFAITAPFRQTARDGYHFTREIVVDALAAHTIHKLDVCS